MKFLYMNLMNALFLLCFPTVPHQALCGCTINAPTLLGKTVTVTATDIVQPGMKRRVSGEGLPYPKRPDRRGDLIVEYEVKFPERLSQSARDTIAQVLPRSWTWVKRTPGLSSYHTLSCQLLLCHHTDVDVELEIAPDGKGQTHGMGLPIIIGICPTRMTVVSPRLECKYDW